MIMFTRGPDGTQPVEMHMTTVRQLTGPRPDGSRATLEIWASKCGTVAARWPESTGLHEIGCVAGDGRVVLGIWPNLHWEGEEGPDGPWGYTQKVEAVIIRRAVKEVASS